MFFAFEELKCKMKKEKKRGGERAFFPKNLVSYFSSQVQKFYRNSDNIHSYNSNSWKILLINFWTDKILFEPNIHGLFKKSRKWGISQEKNLKKKKRKTYIVLHIFKINIQVCQTKLFSPGFQSKLQNNFPG